MIEEDGVEERRARELLAAERDRVEKLLRETRVRISDDRTAAGEGGDMADPAESLTAEQSDDAVARELQQRLEEIVRAENRLRQGTYGRSVRSGRPIPDERLEADPAAELTREEAETR